MPHALAMQVVLDEPAVPHEHRRELRGIERVRPRGDVENSRHPVLIEAERQLGEYFAGRLQEFDADVVLHGTPFQVRVWNALAQIPYGTTGTYGQVARAIGAPRAAQAVGAANGRNPVSLLVPCHRIIGADGRLTGYAGGMERKEYLLRLEGALL